MARPSLWSGNRRLSLVLIPDTVLPIHTPEGRQHMAELYFTPLVHALRPPEKSRTVR